jgi:predicted amidohydrolase YtcJ
MKINHLFYNGNIYTLDPETPVVSSIAIVGNRIVATGNDELRYQFNDAGEKIDLQKKSVIPGLVDAHAHLQLFTQSLYNVDLAGTRDVKEAIKRLQAFADKNREATWIQGWGWCQDDWPDRAFPTAMMIDRVIPDIPVTLTGRSGHATWSNSLAFVRAHITENTPNPVGGEIQRDSQGQPTGILFDNANELVQSVIPPLSAYELAAKMEESIKSIHRVGLTGLHDFDGAESFRALQILNEQNKLTLRVVKNLPVSLLDEVVKLGLRSGFGNDYLRIGAVKIFADGALGSRTAAMFAPYEGEPGNSGIIVTDKEDLIQYASKASRSGFPCAIHAIGDRAVHDVLDAYEAVRMIEKEERISSNTRRHRIEHVQLIHPNDAARLNELGIIASMQPIHATSDMLMADRYWGERAAFSYNPRLQLDHGAMLAFGSDAPVESINPFLGIHAALTRRRTDGSPGPKGWRSEKNERLTASEALRAYTVGPNFAARLDGKLGRLVPGYIADLLVLNQDLFNVDPMDIADTKPESVMIGGNWMVKYF